MAEPLYGLLQFVFSFTFLTSIVPVTVQIWKSLRMDLYLLLNIQPVSKLSGLERQALARATKGFLSKMQPDARLLAINRSMAFSAPVAR